MIYNWTTYPLTCLLEHIWRIGNEALEAKTYPRPVLVELCASVERALNYMHTGNAAVIATSLMNPLWLGLSVVQDGLACVNMRLVPSFTRSVVINDQEWPYNKARQPKSASKGSQLRNYGQEHYNVS